MCDDHPRPASETADTVGEENLPTSGPSRRRFLKRVGVGLGLAAGATAWGYDPDWLTVRRHRIRVPGLEKTTTVVQVSDLHADRRGSCSPRLRERVAEQVRRESPDVIFATGDFITRPGDSVGHAADWVAALPSRDGIYAVLGNHDSSDVGAALRSRGIDVLANAWTKFRGIAVAGVGDLSRGPHAPGKALDRIPHGMGTLLLAHQPDSFWTYREPVTLQLSGHTHGGQGTFFGTVSMGRVAPACSGRSRGFPRSGRCPVPSSSRRVTGPGPASSAGAMARRST